MNRKSIGQEYVILATNKNGKLSSDGKVGVVVAALADLMIEGVVVLEKKLLEIKKDLPANLNHLTSLYEYLNEKPRKMDKVMGDYCLGLTDKRVKALVAEIGDVPKASDKEMLIATIKDEIMQKEELSAHDMALVFVMQETKCLKQYLSKYELDTLKVKLKAMRKDSQNKELRDMIICVDRMMVCMMACVIVSS
jgi:hypothetical protein